MDKVVYYSKRWACLHLSLLKSTDFFPPSFLLQFWLPPPLPGTAIFEMTAYQGRKSAHSPVFRSLPHRSPSRRGLAPGRHTDGYGFLFHFHNLRYRRSRLTTESNSRLPLYRKDRAKKSRLCSSWSESMQYFSCNTTPQIKDDLF